MGYHVYYEEHGDLLPVLAYETETGFALGRWLSTQRINRRKHEPSLTEERIERLDRIGMRWESADDRLWNTFYSAASTYYDEHGNLDIPAEYETADGIKLGRIYRGIRKKYKDGKLSEERKMQLEEIGMQWNSVLIRKWMSYYDKAKLFYEENGDPVIPYDYEVDGLKLGIWLSTQRDNYQKGRITEGQINMLNEIGMSWDRFESKWERGFEYCKRYVEEYGDINKLSEKFVYDDFRPIIWLRAQRYRKRIGKLSRERIEKLESIGVQWDKNQALWDNGYSHAKAYFEEHGSLKMPQGYICEDGFKLKGWLNNQHTKIKNGKLNAERVELLKKIGFEG